ncbi:phospholipase A2 [Amycolatopsis sp. CA-230715]|uniref:phospholipase A2 n=1 Tax=Amycolatopsis sp. CA-230715 TaxID=2745196 RepID=UPI001C0364C9|nr:phospholipase A2 [Amycolatopsis sp. CA-230715]QWF82614.1 hypothetical protein HUW46_06053 [Amycolatopsis sp. CA-230715]
MTAPADAAPQPVRRARRRLSTSAWLLVLLVVVGAFGLIASRSAPEPDRGPLTGGPLAAQHAVEQLLQPGAAPTALAQLPADFTQVTGVRPGSERALDGTVRAVHTDGGCSTPWGDDGTTWNFTVPCKAHDLGYDLLRYAERQGHPLGPEMRAGLDSRLSADMRATCGINPQGAQTACEAVASVFTAGLVLNSWHQRWGPPTGEPIGPMLAGVAVIGCLLVFRLRGWLRHRHTAPVARVRPARAAAGPISPYAVLAVVSLVVLVLGESALALASWAGADPGVLWPLTWLAQLAPLFYFAGGQANAAGWRGVVATGGGYRQYLAHRASWLLRPALVFVVVALVMPLALELLGIPDGTNATVMRIALHPLWLLGVYLLTVIATPPMLALHRKAAVATAAGLLALVVLAELAASWLSSPVPHYGAALGLALLAQQLAFRRAPVPRKLLVAGVVAGLTGLVLYTAFSSGTATLLGDPAEPPALSAAVPPVLLLGLVQVCLVRLFGAKAWSVLNTGAAARVARFALRAPMSLYLGFLAAMLLLVTIVYLPGRLEDDLAWLLQPKPLVALALLAAPAGLVFWWFERHHDGRLPSHREAVLPSGPFGPSLARAATALGICYATVGVFGFALTRFDEQAVSLLGLHFGPIQNLVQLLLGVFLLHAARAGLSAMASTWLVTALACVPALLSAGDGLPGEAAGGAVLAAVHGGTALFAIAAAGTAVWRARTVARVA